MHISKPQGSGEGGDGGYSVPQCSAVLYALGLPSCWQWTAAGPLLSVSRLRPGWSGREEGVHTGLVSSVGGIQQNAAISRPRLPAGQYKAWPGGCAVDWAETPWPRQAAVSMCEAVWPKVARNTTIAADIGSAPSTYHHLFLPLFDSPFP